MLPKQLMVRYLYFCWGINNVNTAVWIVQILLALAFLAAGVLKLTRPKEKLAERMGWVNDFSPSIVKAIGLVLPALTNILPILTPLAAGGLVLDMIGAAATHFRRKEYPMIVGNLVLLALAAFVVYGRLT
jgi:uncharacterized membrane protein YphA (DoxX/SURF4 family)